MSIFATITHIDQVRNAIAARKAETTEFFEAVRGNMSIFNYSVNFAHTFLPLNETGISHEEKINRMILRECRGLIMNNVTGEVIRRPYHKFFNVGETSETQMDCIDLSTDHMILDKMDGSMIGTFVDPNDGRTIWGSKMGETDVALNAGQFVEKNKNYIDLFHEMNELNRTPIFEWCSRRNRIVIDYPVDFLMLTAIRDRTTGEYVEYNDMIEIAKAFGVPIVKAWNGDFENLESFISVVRGLKAVEGFVVRKKDGTMYKIKAEEYLLMHKTKDHLMYEKEVVRILLDDKIDDLKPLLPIEDVVILDRFYEDFYNSMKKKAEELYYIAACAHDNLNGSAKNFNLEVVEHHKPTNEKAILFRIFNHLEDITDGIEFAMANIREVIAKNISTQTKVDSVRNLFGGIKWADYYFVNQEETTEE